MARVECRVDGRVGLRKRDVGCRLDFHSLNSQIRERPAVQGPEIGHRQTWRPPCHREERRAEIGARRHQERRDLIAALDG